MDINEEKIRDVPSKAYIDTKPGNTATIVLSDDAEGKEIKAQEISKVDKI